MTNLKDTWESGKQFETDFWSMWVETKGDKWPKEFSERMNPDFPLDSYLSGFLSGVEGTPRVLDVGAGPITCLGKVLPDGRRIEITAIDPLAQEYSLMFRKTGLTTPVLTNKGEVEKLDDLYPTDTFDLVHMRNALDHSYDPLLGINQMIKVVKPGRVVILEHSTNEAEKANYLAFHQWNICMEDNNLVLWNKQHKINVTQELKAIAKVIAKGDKDWTSVVIEKL